MNLLSRWRQLSSDDRRALWPAAWRLLWVRILLAARGFKSTQAQLSRHSITTPTTLQNPELWQARTRALQRISRRLPDTRCLARSLALWWWMRQSKLAPHLHMGVAQGESNLEGHAWVECDGHLFDETHTGATRWSALPTPFKD